MKLHNSNGFTFIEVLIAVVIVSVAAFGLMLGAVHARGELQALEIRERATEELLSFVETMKGRVADGRLTGIERSGDLEGKQVFLLGNNENPDKIEAKIYYDPIYEEPSDSSGGMDRYRFKTWITWKDYTSARNDVKKTRVLEMVMLEYPL